MTLPFFEIRNRAEVLLSIVQDEMLDESSTCEAFDAKAFAFCGSCRMCRLVRAADAMAEALGLPRPDEYLKYAS